MRDTTLKIGFYSTLSPWDRKAWSGSIFKMREALEAHGCEITWIPPIEYSEKEQKILNMVENLYKKIFNRGYNRHQNIPKALIAGKKMTAKVDGHQLDALFMPTAATELAYMNKKLPVFYVNDATFHQLINYYDGYKGFGYLSKKTTEYIEKKALQKADAISFPSEWAANCAKNYYKIPSYKVYVHKFGSNSDAPDHIIPKVYTGEITFLFLGVDWVRKGGAIALETTRLLKERGYNVKLLVVGCIPPVQAPYMEVIPFLDKNKPEEAKKIKEVLANSHFLFLPTRAECYGIVFCEAASYGLPVITTATGGVTAIVEHGVTGIALPKQADANEYAQEIEMLLKNPIKIQHFAENARKKYDDELNWKEWGRNTASIIRKIIT